MLSPEKKEATAILMRYLWRMFTFEIASLPYGATTNAIVSPGLPFHKRDANARCIPRWPKNGKSYWIRRWNTLLSSSYSNRAGTGITLRVTNPSLSFRNVRSVSWIIHPRVMRMTRHVSITQPGGLLFFSLISIELFVRFRRQISIHVRVTCSRTPVRFLYINKRTWRIGTRQLCANNSLAQLSHPGRGIKDAININFDVYGSFFKLIEYITHFIFSEWSSRDVSSRWIGSPNESTYCSTWHRHRDAQLPFAGHE